MLYGHVWLLFSVLKNKKNKEYKKSKFDFRFKEQEQLLKNINIMFFVLPRTVLKKS